MQPVLQSLSLDTHTLASLMMRGRVNDRLGVFRQEHRPEGVTQARWMKALGLKVPMSAVVTMASTDVLVGGFSLPIPLSGFSGRPERLPVHLFVAP